MESRLTLVVSTTRAGYFWRVTSSGLVNMIPEEYI
jgi:hypothetical protein